MDHYSGKMLLGVGFDPDETVVLMLQVEILFAERGALVGQVRVDFDVTF
jgi:hypothetical protein